MLGTKRVKEKNKYERIDNMEKILHQILGELKDVKQEIRSFKEENQKEHKEMTQKQKKMEEDIVEIKAEQKTMKQDIVEIKDKQGKMEQDIIEIKDKQGKMEQDIIEIKGKQGKMEQDIVEIKAEQKTMKQDIVEIKQKQEILEDKVAHNTKLIQEITKDMIDSMDIIKRTVTRINNNQVAQIKQLMVRETVNFEKNKEQDAILALHHERIGKCEKNIREWMQSGE